MNSLNNLCILIFILWYLNGLSFYIMPSMTKMIAIIMNCMNATVARRQWQSQYANVNFNATHEKWRDRDANKNSHGRSVGMCCIRITYSNGFLNKFSAEWTLQYNLSMPSFVHLCYERSSASGSKLVLAMVHWATELWPNCFWQATLTLRRISIWVCACKRHIQI